MKKLAVRLVLATSLALPTALARLEEFTPGPSPERVARLRDRPQAADAPQGRIDLLIVPCALAEAAPQPTLPPRVRRPASGDSRLTAGTDMSGHLLVIDTSGRLVGCAVPAPALAGG